MNTPNLIRYEASWEPVLTVGFTACGVSGVLQYVECQSLELGCTSAVGMDQIAFIVLY